MSNIAVVGAGYWGQNLVRVFARLGALRLICDASAEHLAAMRAQYPSVEATAQFGDVLQRRDIDAVVIATPAVQHYAMARDALLAGKDVFVEKPLALTVTEGHQLVQLAAEHGRLLLVGDLLEYHPAMVALKQMVNDG